MRHFPPVPFKDAAGSLAAFIVVLAFIAVGFLQGLGNAVFGVDVTVNDAWSSGLFGLANAALGYLIGKNDSPAIPPQGYPPTAPESPLPPVAMPCNMPECPHRREQPPYG